MNTVANFDSFAVTAEIPEYFSTFDSDPGDYWLYAVDLYENVSDAFAITIQSFGTGTPEINSAVIRLYPTLVEDVLNIETDQSNASVELYNVF